MSTTKDSSISLTPFPGSFMEPSAQPETHVPARVKVTEPPRAADTQDPAGKTINHTSLIGLGQSELSPTEAIPMKSTSASENSSSFQLEVSGGSVRTERKQGEGQNEQGLPHRRVVLGQQSLPQDFLKTGDLGKPNRVAQDPSQLSDPSVTTSYLRLAGTTQSRSEGLGPAQCVSRISTPLTVRPL